MKNSNAPISGGQINGAKIIRQMYPATCSQCGKACEVPFIPSPDKPTYCKECFEKRKLATKAQIAAKQYAGFDRLTASNNPKQGNGAGDIKQQLSTINSKLDRLIQMLGTKESAPVKTDETAASVKKIAKKVLAKKKAVSKKK
ncbi:MAG: hypothetical protein UY70_C0002G0013 [Candidatus Kaiserbacteria bacterium GW2011_GWB1_52_6]|uniref:CxxC-x17-CxxC domain-containing protein n=3 Tax=Candidatus Kaiseribacteriota TaxID=1752734 RepID=A0A0G1XHQ7_9BACT|nr:MAG: hypothetical protein UY67_C0002G0013 [Candidatus Kaiserbacteria bacterium GW2011_GWA2_52_12]KKW28139.1 MAG: hypothetical protein UY70_C0002G0013 [Candidatus Kaiserbacteria bacterium GW2011_GWB1_52_6]KKW30768.1 MAG: hypothetical protein UY74_C0032G0013 [Candidatus Kaiserbacteria bacterium GW2011_GWC2_52_8b]